jgi:hypothetical protein
MAIQQSGLNNDYSAISFEDIEGWQEFPELTLHGVLNQHIDSRFATPKLHSRKITIREELPFLGSKNIFPSISHIRKVKELQTLICSPESNEPSTTPKLKKKFKAKLTKLQSRSNTAPNQSKYESKKISMPPSVSHNKIILNNAEEGVSKSTRGDYNWSFETENQKVEKLPTFPRDPFQDDITTRPRTIESFRNYQRVKPQTAYNLANSDMFPPIYVTQNTPLTSTSLNQWRSQIESLRIEQLCRLLPTPREITTSTGYQTFKRCPEKTIHSSTIAGINLQRADISYSLPLATYELRQINVKRWTSLPSSIDSKSDTKRKESIRMHNKPL